MNDYDISLKDKCCYIFKNNMFYAKAIIENGIFVLDLIKEVHNVDTKRMKQDNLNTSYLWHCRLGHINEKELKWFWT